MKTIDYSYFIEKYNAGEMDQAEKTWFEKELLTDKSLQKEVMLRKKTDKILERQDIISLRNKLASIEKMRTFEKKRNVKWQTPRFRYAAVIAGLVLIGSLLFVRYNKQSSDQVFRNNYIPYEIQDNSRSAEATYNEAVGYYKNGEFSKALEAFESYLENNPGSTKTLFYSGVTNLELRNYERAETSFIKVIDNKPNLYIEDANYYLAMCYIKTKKIILAKTQLKTIINSESKKYKTLAESALRKL
jgi:TolA-binding protein